MLENCQVRGGGGGVDILNILHKVRQILTEL